MHKDVQPFMDSGVQRSVLMRYTVFLRQHDGLHYAVVPLLPLCSAQGRTREEVLHNVKVATASRPQQIAGSTRRGCFKTTPCLTRCWLQSPPIGVR